MASQVVIQTEKLTKVYSGGKPALEDLSLTVAPGEIFGYLGPNGAGKTTTIRLLLDLIRPTSGRAAIFGLDTIAQSVAIRQRIGFLPGELNLWDRLTAREIVNYMGNLRGGVNTAYVNELAERLNFDLTKRMRTYSTGNKRKLGLILALMHKPDLLILDEPSSGLDPLMQQTFNQLMLEAKANGQTVFLSSHVLNEVQAICDRVGILRDGKLQAVETVERLTRVDFRKVTLKFRDAVSPLLVSSVAGVSKVSAEGANVLSLQLAGDFDPLLKAVSSAYVQDILVETPTLEDIFLTFYGGQPANNHREKVMS
ncbi:MAG: ABC transporter ATP-binding protein [Anaerolineae bacterium]|nr:ABC transporter ATP-binding protein [Chloroflexota bacterium]MBN8636698.1 ABC transporter ATP-binding protein [Anaerolineae bacterium]